MEMRGMPKYSDYTQSCHDWIGPTPSHWIIKRLQDVASCNDDTVDERAKRDASIKYVDISAVSSETNTYTYELQAFRDAPSRARRLVKSGDTIFSTVRPYLKAVATIQNPDPDLVVSTGFAVARPRHGNNSAFLGYALRNEAFISQVSANSVGASYPAINASDLFKLKIPLPPAGEQRAIVAFLDDKCAKIEGAVKIKEDQIALLRERRQIIIQDAVTHGLSPSTPMKDSGIDWIGRIPAHWDIFPLLSVANVKSVSNRPDLELLSVYLDRGVVPFADVEEKRTNATSLDLSAYQVVEVGDLVLNNQQAWRGSVGVSEFHGIVSPAYIVLSLSGAFDSKFANFYFRVGSTVAHYLINSKGVGTIQRNLYWPKLKRSLVTIPPKSEQVEIVKYIQENTDRIDEGIAIKECQIAALKEYKTSLINAAVTGKIKVI